jgi:hypothetical protein
LNVRASISTTLPDAAVSGSNLKAKALLGLVNLSAESISADGTVAMFLSSDDSFDAGDTSVGEPSAIRLQMRGYGMKRVPLRIANVPPVPDGTYHLLARVDAGGAGAAVAATVKTIDLRPPVAALQVSTAGPAAREGLNYVVPVAIHNLGNMAARGPAMLSLSLDSGDGGARAPAAATAQVKLNLKPGATLVRKIVFQLPAELSPGSSTPTVTLNVDAIPHASVRVDDDALILNSELK